MYVKIPVFGDYAGYAMVCFESMTMKWSDMSGTNAIRREAVDDIGKWFNCKNGHQYSKILASDIEKAYQRYIIESILLGHKDI